MMKTTTMARTIKMRLPQTADWSVVSMVFGSASEAKAGASSRTPKKALFGKRGSGRRGVGVRAGLYGQPLVVRGLGYDVQDASHPVMSVAAQLGAVDVVQSFFGGGEPGRNAH